jgi:gamma-glutamyltranspeptidase/glutathione hydrolase
VLDFGLDVGKAVSSPRFHMQHLPDVVMFEKNGLPEALNQSLTTMGYTFKERPWIADAPAIGREANGSAWIGVAEPRRPGGLAAAPQ